MLFRTRLHGFNVLMWRPNVEEIESSQFRLIVIICLGARECCRQATKVDDIRLKPIHRHS